MRVVIHTPNLKYAYYSNTVFSADFKQFGGVFRFELLFADGIIGVFDQLPIVLYNGKDLVVSWSAVDALTDSTIATLNDLLYWDDIYPFK